MKKAISLILLVAIVVTIFVPALAMPAQSNTLQNKEMGCLVGGMMTVSCFEWADAVNGLCQELGGDRGSCSVISGSVYLGCLLGGLLGIF